MPEDGYPTDEEHERLVTFEGTPREFCEYVDSIYQNGFTSVELIEVEYTKGKVYEFRTVTGGWSGCEHTDGVIKHGNRDDAWDQTFFRMRFWESDHRGGLTVYHIKEKDWETQGFWGSLSRWSGAEETV